MVYKGKMSVLWLNVLSIYWVLFDALVESNFIYLLKGNSLSTNLEVFTPLHLFNSSSYCCFSLLRFCTKTYFQNFRKCNGFLWSIGSKHDETAAFRPRTAENLIMLFIMINQSQRAFVLRNL